MIKTIAENYNILEITTRILVAYIVGALIGWERAQHKKPIGSRTTSIVCMGAAILSCYEEVFAKSILIQNSQLMEIGSKLLYSMPDYSRITAQIVSGIGFLGAGMIIQNRGKLHGITTAAIVWVTACLGIVIGSGEWGLSAIGCFCIFLSTSIYRVPYFLAHKNHSVIYLIEYNNKIDIESEIDKFGIKIMRFQIVGWKENKIQKDGNELPNIIGKIHIFVPNLDYDNIEKIFINSNIKPIKKLRYMNEKVDLNSL
ncbi:MgtC/SapB family protein [Brachyspira pilosicoli]|uniref:MgtC/SapB family protein n=1 Tax=Brachyspira pilosicoli TaxID=52584 RepID=UPI001C682F28|nr:MgtC/SapB family protein [Brachyspira pilosicoli]MBW5392565.1 MgtC/SapB family protein [Brachyspira pilosicoli]